MHRSHYIDSRSAGNKQFQSLRYTHLGTIQSIKNHVNKKVNLDGTSYASIKHLHRAVTLKDHKKKSSAQLLKKKEGWGSLTIAPKLCPISCETICHSVLALVDTAVPETTVGLRPLASC